MGSLSLEVAFEEPTLADGQVTLTWSGAGVLKESSELETWSDVTPQPAENTLTVTPGSEDTGKIYRISVGE
jgi:hypothetical protein